MAAFVREPSLTVKNLTNELSEVVNWQHFGTVLGIKQHKLEEIRMNKFGDIQLCKISLFDLWLRSDLYASWAKVEKALNEIGSDVQAQAVRDKYMNTATVPGAAARAKVGSLPVVGGATGARNMQSEQPRSHVMEVDTPTAIHRDLTYAQNLIQSKQPEGEEDNKMVKMINHLTHAQVNVNHIDPDDENKQSLLHYVVQKNDIESLKALVAFGALVNFKNRHGLTPLDMAQMLTHKDIEKLLIEVGGKRGAQLGTPGMGVRGQQAQAIEGNNMGAATNNVLVLDNSSTLALVQLEMLNQIEVATGEKITDIFQWIVASGIGGLLMMFMVYGNKSISDLRKLYFQLRERVFANQTVADKSKELESFVIEVLGDTKRMSDTTEPKLLIGAVNKRTTHMDLHFFNNCFSDDLSRAHVWKVARYTCSFPFILGEIDNYVDTGVLCKNPTDLALSRIKTQCPDVPIDAVVSLGDGILPARDLGTVSLPNFLCPGARITNLDETISRLQNIVTLYISANDALSRETAKSHESVGTNYQFFRYNPLLEDQLPVPEDASLDALINVVFQTIAYVVKDDVLSLLCAYVNN